MCTCKILRFIARTILGTGLASLIAVTLFAFSLLDLKDWILLATVLVLAVAGSCAILALIYLATKHCDGDR